VPDVEIYFLMETGRGRREDPEEYLKAQ